MQAIRTVSFCHKPFPVETVNRSISLATLLTGFVFCVVCVLFSDAVLVVDVLDPSRLFIVGATFHGFRPLDVMSSVSSFQLDGRGWLWVVAVNPSAESAGLLDWSALAC
jgi:hypothetical protein